MLDTKILTIGVFLLAKFTVEEKVKAVKEYLNGVEGHRIVANKFGVSGAVLRNWVKQYQFHGEEAFLNRYTNYSVQYKLDVLNYMNDHGTSINETAAIFNIPSPSRIRQWLIDYESGGMDALISKKKGRPSMKKENQKQTKAGSPVESSVAALQAEIERLRMENAYLKKLNALVQNKEKSPNKTKHK